MKVWVYESDSDFYLFKTREAALKEAEKDIYNWYADSLAKKGVKEISEKGYWGDYQIYEKEVFEQ